MDVQQTKKHLDKVFLNLPIDFLMKKQFCLWKYEQRTNATKLSKIPYFFCENKATKANIKDSKQWLTGFDALKIAMQHDFSGIGFIMLNTNFFGIDLDNCIQEGKLLTWAQEIVNHFIDTYIEVSPSGQGLHILGHGELNLTKNISPINKYVEAYDSKSVRYLTLTGNLFKQSSTTFSYYKKNNDNLKWLRRTFFSTDFTEKQKNFHEEYFKNANYLNKQNTEEQIWNIEQSIQKSKDAKLFHKYRSKDLVNHRSTSEDDWHFCLLILKYMKSANSKLLLEFLLKYRDRIKLKRTDYIKLTVEKAIEEAEKRQTIGINIQQPRHIKNTSKTASKVKKKDIIKHCNMFSLFTVRDTLFLEQKQILVKQDDENFIKIFTHQSLSGVDLDNYIGILQIANLDLDNEEYSDSHATGNLLNTIKVKINFSKLSRIIKKQDGGKFRHSILQTIRKMSSIYFEYKKVIDKEGNLVEGGSHLLSWFSNTDTSKNTTNITVGINPFAWYIMKNSKYNYCLINTKERFKLNNVQQRLLYFYLCRKVIPGSHYFHKFSIEELSNDLWGYTSNNNTHKARKKSIRKLCQELYLEQNQLTDFEIHLVKQKLTIQYISVKRYKVFLD